MNIYVKNVLLCFVETGSPAAAQAAIILVKTFLLWLPQCRDPRHMHI